MNFIVYLFREKKFVSGTKSSFFYLKSECGVWAKLTMWVLKTAGGYHLKYQVTFNATDRSVVCWVFILHNLENLMVKDFSLGFKFEQLLLLAKGQ